MSKSSSFLLLLSLLLCICSSQVCSSQGRECYSGECCSTHGWCGSGDAWCGAGNCAFQCDGVASGGSDTDSDTDCPQCPICPGENRTYAPTSAPVEQPVFTANCHCHCYGDPHCQMWNCDVNNYQGPHGVDPAGQFYYLTPCAGRGFDYTYMPFNVIGVNQRYDGYFTSVDYTIVELFDDDGDKVFCIKIKGNSGVSYNTDCGDTFSNTPNQASWVTLSVKFKIKYENVNGLVYLYLDVLEGDENAGACNPDLTIMTATATSREEDVVIKISECYKKFTCGMCGNFYDAGLYFEKIDGSYIWLSSGSWGGTANYADGLSYLIAGTMGSSRRRLIDEDDEPCYGNLDALETQCGVEIEEYSDCCDERSDFCDEIVTPNCKWDACSCVMGYDEGDVTDAVLEECVASTMSATMNTTCIMPADDFAIPESLGIEEVEEMTSGGSCDNSSGGGIGIGIAIGCAIFIVIDIIIYFAYLKKKLDVAQRGYGGVGIDSTDQSDIN